MNGRTEIVVKDQTELMDELSKLILEKDYLVCQRSVQLRTEYMMKIGAIEHRVHKVKIELNKAKRRLMLMRSYINNGKEPNMDDIESVLRSEFAKYSEEIKRQADEVRKAIDLSLASRPLSKEESTEIRDLYYRIVKSVHPDMNPDVDDRGKELYLKAVEAYKKGDIDCIRALYWTMDSNDIPRYIDGIESKITKVRYDIERIKSTFPFDKIDLLNDELALAERKEELEDLERRYTEELDLVNGRIKGMEATR